MLHENKHNLEVTAANQNLLPPRPANYADWIRAGFFVALGVALLTLLALFAWRLSLTALTIAAPFAIAMVLALLLDPLADRLEQRGLKRGPAAGVVFAVFLLLLIGIGALAIPALVNQGTQLAQNSPEYIANLQSYTDRFLKGHHKILGFALPKNFNALSAQISARTSEMVRSYIGSVTSFLIGSISTLFEIVITLIVTFYLLLDIDRLRARVFYLVPERARGPMSVFAKDIGGVFSNYLRGLLIVSALYGVTTIAFLFAMSLIHSQLAGYALLVGVVGGLLYVVPYIGPLVTALITFLVAFAAGGVEFGGIAVVMTLFLNQIFDNIVTPRVVGGGVGLHPVISLFALTLGGALFGLWGLLLSVPIAASVQVVLFRLFPKLTTKTPDVFLRAQGVRPEESASAQILGDIPVAPPG